MKTLTEFSGTVIRMAAQAEATARRALPKRAPKGEAEQKPAEAAEVAAAPQEQGEAAEAQGEVVEQTASEQAQAPAEEAAGEEGAPKAAKTEVQEQAEPEESDEERAALDAAVTQATGIEGDRLARLREALKVVGRRADEVRLVRVFQMGEEEKAAPGAKVIGSFQYIVDKTVMKVRELKREDERGGKGGRGKGGRGRGDKDRGGRGGERAPGGDRGPGASRGKPGEARKG